MRRLFVKATEQNIFAHIEKCPKKTQKINQKCTGIENDYDLASMDFE